MAKATFYIKKKAGKEVTNVFRLTGPESVPEHLRSAVRFTDEGIFIDNVDNKVDYCEKAAIGVVIAYETTEDENLNGWNLWVKSNAAETLDEKDGKFYQKPAIVEAQFITDEFPEFIRGAKISYDAQAKFPWSLDCGWAVVSGKSGDIWAKYGEKDGVIDANIIAVNQEDTVSQYFVCTAEGEIIEPLADFLKK